MRATALTTVVLAILVRLVAPGWVLIVGWPIYTALVVLHLNIQRAPALPPYSHFHYFAVASNILFFIAFFLQIDFADCAYSPITTILSWIGLAGDCPFKVSDFWASESSIFWIDAIFFMPVLLAWALMTVVRYRERRKLG